MPNDKSVQISANGNQLAVNNSSVSISKSNADQVKWTSSVPNVTVTVSFDKGQGSPFNNSSFSVDTTGTTPSGPVKSGANAGGASYGYSLSAPGFTKLDPTVIVDN
ncbi:MAG: hypothetical protein ACR2IF_04865 [Terriglobales bacterium]